jgi:hypothetical protein
MIAALLLVVLLLAAPAGAQVTCTAPMNGVCATPTTTTASMAVPTLGRLVISASSTAIQSGVSVSVGDYEASETGDGNVFTGPVVSVSANKAYSITFTNPTSFPTSPNAKTAADVRWSVNGAVGVCSASYTALSTSGATQLLASGAATALVQRQLCFRVKWLWASDPPGTYQMPLTFTLTAP